MPAQKLAWDDKWVERLQQEIEGADCDTSAPYVFNSGDNYVLFKFTPQQFNQILSALAVGADFAYPDTAHQVYWNFVKAVECPMQICELFIECLENDTDTINALAQLIINNPTIRDAVAQAAAAEGIPAPGTPLSAQSRSAQMLPDNVFGEEGCILNALWGAVLNVTQQGKETISDAFQILESASNALERASIAADLIPVVGTYPAQAAQFADQLLEEIAEGFEASYTTPYEQALACELFCLAKQNCELSLDDVIGMFVARLSTISFTDYLEFMNYIITGTFVGSQIADAAFLCYFLALKFGSQFLDIIGIQPLTVQMGLGADVLNSDNWETLCEVCTYTHTWNAETGFDGWELLSWAGNPMPTITDGKITGSNANDGVSILLYTGRTLPSNVNKIKVDYEYIRIDNANTNDLYLTTDTLSPVYSTTHLVPPSGVGIAETSSSPSGVAFRILSGVDGRTNTGQLLQIRAIYAIGEEPDPF